MDEMIKAIKEIMINVATGKTRIEEMNDEYQHVYSELDSEFSQQGLENPNKFSDLWEFYHYWKENLLQYSDRRNFIIKLYKIERNAEKTTVDFWALIHPLITRIAKTRFDTNHYADAVEAALKEVNVCIKAIYRERTSQEDDGASLMKKTFSVNRPVISLDDISNETGRNIQQGYMELFSGAMIGIRNPKAHANITITKERAIHFLFLASLLMHKLDDAGVLPKTED